MVKLSLSLAAAFAAFAPINAQKPAGSILRLKTSSTDLTDQIRVLTKPKPGYNAANDHPTVYQYGEGECEITTGDDFLFSTIDDASKCCRLQSLDGFKIWEEQQNYAIPNTATIEVDNEVSDECFERSKDNNVKGVAPLAVGEVYNVYMIQVWQHAQITAETDNVVEFHNQDVFALIHSSDRLTESDQYFGLGGAATYEGVKESNKPGKKDYYGRGLEFGKDSFAVNCESRPSPGECPCPNCGSSSKGDPHFKTWNKEHFEFHGQCDMILAKDNDFASGIGLDVQIRTKLVRFWSYIHTAAIRIGHDILEIQGHPDDDDREIRYWFNFQYQADTTSIGGFPLSLKSNGVNKRFYEIDLSSKFPGQKIVISTFKEFVSVDFEGGSVESFGNTVGMLGDYKSGKTLARDGAREIHDFNELGNEWQLVPSDDMLFHDKAEPQFPKRCILPEDPQGERRRRLDESTISIEQAEAACATLEDPLTVKDCVYDILATQDMDMVGAF
jgi:hypothetical protein